MACSTRTSRVSSFCIESGSVQEKRYDAGLRQTATTQMTRCCNTRFLASVPKSARCGSIRDSSSTNLLNTMIRKDPVGGTDKQRHRKEKRSTKMSMYHEARALVRVGAGTVAPSLNVHAGTRHTRRCTTCLLDYANLISELDTGSVPRGCQRLW